MLKQTLIGMSIMMALLGGGSVHAATLEGVTVDCGGFVRNIDGSWSTIANAEIKGPQSTFTIGPRTELKIGHKYQGLDLARILDATCR